MARTPALHPGRATSTPRRAVLATLLCASTAACGGCAVLTPRFPDDVQTAVVRDDMRRMETDTLLIYYPEGRAAEARRVAGRIGYCTQALRTHAPIHDRWTDQKPRIVLAHLPYNNAFFSPPLLSEPIAVVPTHNTSMQFAAFNLPPDPGVIGCHEAVHYVQLLQTGGFPRFITRVFGSAYTPQIGIESWFHEGLAVYYETKLLGGLGRLGTRYYEGILAAGVAGQQLNGGWLHYLNRKPLHGGHYLVGSFFVDWLARTYGENRLWAVVGEQARAVLPPFGVSGRFNTVYGKSLSTLLDEFATELAKRYPQRSRPHGQATIRELGREARYVRSRDGWEAAVERSLDHPTRLVVRAPSGRVVMDRNLTDVMPGRTLIQPSPAGTSGMDFSPDRRLLYFVMLDAGPVFQKSRLVRVDLARERFDIVHDDVGGPGGGLTPDGAHYVFARAQGDAFGVASVDLASGKSRWIRAPEPGVYLHAPRISPDGSRILAIRSDSEGTRLALLDASTGALLAAPRAPLGPTLEASWIDDDAVVYVGSEEGRLQVFVTQLASGRVTSVSHAPYLAFNPQSDGRTVRFLNRQDWHWTLDEVPLPKAEQVEVPEDGSRWLGRVMSDAPRVLVRGKQRDALGPPASEAFLRRVRPQEQEAKVLRDEPYSQLDGLLFPQVRGPWLVVRDSYSTIVGVGAGGGDRLGYHRWALGVGVDTNEPQPSAQLDYRNALLAPLFLRVTLARYVARERIDDGKENSALTDIVAEELLGVLALERTWFDNTLAWGWRVNAVHRDQEHSDWEDRRRFGGPFLAANYVGRELTAYTGVRRGLSMSASASYLPKGLSTASFNVTDLSGEAGFVVPLPLSTLHTLRAAGRSRTLRGVPNELGLLQVGGGGGVFSGTSAEQLGDRTGGVLPPRLRFYEPLRGFEDLARYGSHLVSGELAYRFPFIVDRGTASSLSFMPSTFLREIAIEPFGTGATLLDGTEAAWAAGASVDVGVAIWLLPLDLRFQTARRLSDDESWAFYFTVLGSSEQAR